MGHGRQIPMPLPFNVPPSLHARAQVPFEGGLPTVAHQGQAQALATAAAERLLQLSLARGTVDNVTVVVMLLQWASNA